MEGGWRGRKLGHRRQLPGTHQPKEPGGAVASQPLASLTEPSGMALTKVGSIFTEAVGLVSFPRPLHFRLEAGMMSRVSWERAHVVQEPVHLEQVQSDPGLAAGGTCPPLKDVNSHSEEAEAAFPGSGQLLLLLLFFFLRFIYLLLALPVPVAIAGFSVAESRGLSPAVACRAFHCDNYHPRGTGSRLSAFHCSMGSAATRHGIPGGYGTEPMSPA